MPNRYPHILIALLTALTLAPCAWAGKGKTLVYDNYVYEDQIRTVQLYRGQDQLGFPVLSLNQEAKLTLDFDELRTTVSTFNVSFIHCDADWQPSQLFGADYYEGLMQEPILESKLGFNTRVGYTHYRYSFPNEGSKFKVSGNYILKVYRGYDEDDLILTRKFIITENQIQIQPSVGLTQNAGQRMRLQQVNFNLVPGGFSISNPGMELKVLVLQNFRWDNARSFSQPQYMYPDKLEYMFDAGQDFMGGNEYRMFDTRTQMINSFGVAAINQVENNVLEYTLALDQPRTNNIYTTNLDLNGMFYIANRDDYKFPSEVDYAYVKFRLASKQPVTKGNVYVFGQLTDWRLQEPYRLMYNASTQQYEGSIMLKQGLYNYHYVVGDPAKGTLEEVKFEGSHMETENTYSILVYYRPIGGRTDRLIAVRHINNWN